MNSFSSDGRKVYRGCEGGALGIVIQAAELWPLAIYHPKRLNHHHSGPIDSLDVNEDDTVADMHHAGPRKDAYYDGAMDPAGRVGTAHHL